MGAAKPKPSQNQLKIGLTKDHQHLVALLPKVYSDTAQIDREWIQKQVTSKGFDDLYPLEESIDKLLELYNSHTTIKKLIPIAERRDAEVRIEISSDNMSVFLHLTPAFGGAEKTKKDVFKLLVEQKIINGVDEDAIDDAIAKGRAEYKVIAEGVPVVHGEDSRFESLLPEIKIRAPKVKEDGSVDFRDLGQILVVEQGAELMRRIPATNGSVGHDVFGNKIEPITGEDIAFSTSLEGAEPSPNDPNLLLAVHTGQPVIVSNGVNVEKVISYEKVDLSVGNIDFDGSVIITGDVAPGMRIKVSGDISVEGFVEAATLIAGGDINIENSFIGHGDIYDQRGDLKKEVASATAGGSFCAKYIENVQVTTSDSIMIQEQSLRCELEAKNEIVVGGKGSKTGHVIGGHVRSGILIKANVYGSPAGARTYLEVTADDSLHKKVEKLNNSIQEAQIEYQRKRTFLSAQKPESSMFDPERYKQTKIEIKKLERRLDALTSEKESLKMELKRIDNGKIVTDSVIHAGTTIQIGKQKKIINENLQTRTYRILEGRLTIA
jgi:uncharacterized protein (DUF342 family)